MDTIRPLRRLEALLNVPDPGDEVDDAAADRLVVVLRDHGENLTRLEPEEAAQLYRALERLRDLLRVDHVDVVAARINEIFDELAARPRLSRHDGTPWHLHVVPDDADWERWLLAGSALALATALQEHGSRTWGQCAADGCDRYFIGDGRGGERLYCSARCASRARVARHRGRVRSTAV